MDEKLKPCPACGSSRVRLNEPSRWVTCNNSDCLLDGPTGDSDGAKWNALPRRTDAPAGMSDGEKLIKQLERIAFALEDIRNVYLNR